MIATSMSDMVSLVALRPVAIADSHLLYSWICNQDLQRFSSPFKYVTYEQHETWLQRRISGFAESPFLLITEVSSLDAIGYCQLFDISHIDQSCELQIKICLQTHLGKGYGSCALKLLLEYAFFHLNLNRVQLRVLVDNVRAVAAYKKCGFKEEGLLRQAAFMNGALRDMIMMSILKDEFGINI